MAAAKAWCGAERASLSRGGGRRGLRTRRTTEGDCRERVCVCVCVSARTHLLEFSFSFFHTQARPRRPVQLSWISTWRTCLVRVVNEQQNHSGRQLPLAPPAAAPRPLSRSAGPRHHRRPHHHHHHDSCLVPVHAVAAAEVGGPLLVVVVALVAFAAAAVAAVASRFHRRQPGSPQPSLLLPTDLPLQHGFSCSA